MRPVIDNEIADVKSVLFTTAPLAPEVLTMVEYVDGTTGIHRNDSSIDGRKWTPSRLDDCITTYRSLCASWGLK